MITYNHAPYIRRAIDGILSQRTSFPFELVIGEDCSTDGTREIVAEYANRYPGRVRVVTSNQNVGMHKNARRTFEACRGEVVAFCEGDDFWHDPRKLEAQVGFLAENPSYGMVHTNYDVNYVVEGKLRKNEATPNRALRDDQAYAEVMCGTRRILTLTVCVRRELLELVVRDNPECTDPYWPMGDTQRWLELCRIGKVKYLPQSTATYNVLPNSASRSRDPHGQLTFTEKAGRLMLHYLAKYPLPREQEELARRRTAVSVLRAAHAAADREAAAYWYGELKLAGREIPLAARVQFFSVEYSLLRLLSLPILWSISTATKLRRRAYGSDWIVSPITLNNRN